MPPRVNFLALLFVAVVQLAPARAQAANRWFPIVGNPEFADVRAQLQVVVDEHAHERANQFCVVGEKGHGFMEAWVYWPADNKLILWLPDHDNPHAIAGSKRYLDLTRDVVDGTDVQGSTYKLTRATANDKIRACAQHGNIYTIQKSTGSDGHG